MFKTFGKRYLSLILAVMLVVSLLPLSAQAAEITGLNVENLSASVNFESSNSVWSASDNSISGTATTQTSGGGGGCGGGGCGGGSSSMPSVPTLTLTNTGDKAAKLTFSYALSLNRGVVKIDGVNATQNGSFEKVLTKGGSVKITLVSGDSSTSVNLTSIALTPVETPPTPIDPDDPVIDDDEVALSENGMTASKDLGGMHMDKTLIQNDDGTFSVKLQAYATGVYTSTTSTDPVPTDIVLVLDQSGSMEYNLTGNKSRLTALKNAANLFIDNVKNDTDEYGNAMHRVAIVGFSDGADSYGNTEIFDGTTEYNYGLVTSSEAGYIDASALTLKWTDDAGAALLHASVDNLVADSATCSNLGLELAYRILNDRTAKEKETRNSVVIFLTDGEPGGYNSNSQNLTVANGAIATAYKLKHDFNAKIFSVGILTSDSSKVAGTQKTIKDYMERVSSHYPDAKNLTDNAGTRVDSVVFYSRTDGTANTLDLDAIFASITQSISEATTPVKLDVNAVMKDVIDTDNFSVIIPNGSDKPSVTVQTMKGTQTSEAGTADTIAWGTAQNDTTPVVSYDSTSGTVSVSNFDYASNYIGYGKAAGNGLEANQGRKLIVTINGLQLIRAEGESTPLPSNKSAGIYESGTAEKPTIQVDRPWTTAGKASYVIDFNAKMILGAGFDQLGYKTGNNGEFNLNEGVLTYQLLPKEQLGDRAATLVMNGVDTAMTYTSSSKVWTQHTTIPANNIYFDDALLGTQVAVADGAGYNVSVTTEASAAVTPITDGDDLVYTFKGTGIDVYCSTNAVGGYVQAGLMTGDSAVPANLVYFKSADGHYYKVGDNYVRIDKDHPAPDGAALYDTSLIAVRNYSVTPEGKDRYNVPTVSYTGLPYGTYTIRIKAVDNANYKLDGIRIYNSMDDPDKDSVYAGTDEANAHFYNLREALVNDGQNVTVNTKDETKEMSVYLEGQTAAALPGVLFIDKADSVTLKKTVVDAQGNFVLDENGQPKKELVYKDAFSAYVANGPKNEIYLDKGQGIAFKIADSAQGDKYWLGLSVPDQDSTSAVVAVNGTAVKPTITSAVDMYYEITPRTDGTVVIVNNGDAMVSVTNLKVTSKLPGDKAASPFALMSADALDLAAEATAVESQETPVDQSLKDIFQQLISNFVRILFNNIARMFGK